MIAAVVRDQLGKLEVPSDLDPFTLAIIVFFCSSLCRGWRRLVCEESSVSLPVCSLWGEDYLVVLAEYYHEIAYLESLHYLSS